ncbi:hypothetical protein D3C85_1271020 [compost metagenome]
MMLAVHRLHALPETDEPDRQTAMLQQISNRLLRSEMLAAFPYAFTHHKVGGFGLLSRLDMEAVEQSLQGNVQVMIQLPVKA